MKNHILTIVLLLVACIAFTLRFCTKDTIQSVCDILAFGLPTLAAIFEIIVSERSAKKMKEEIKKRAIFEPITQEDYERRKAEGTIDDNTYYPIIDK